MKNLIPQALLLILAFVIFGCGPKEEPHTTAEESTYIAELPHPTSWYQSFKGSYPPLTNESMTWLETQRQHAEVLSKEALFNLDFKDRMTVILLRRSYHLNKESLSSLPAHYQDLWELLLEEPQLKSWNTARHWIKHKKEPAFAQRRNPSVAILFLENEGDGYALNLVKSIQRGLRPLEVKYSKLGSTSLGLALNFLALQGEKGFGSFLLDPLKEHY